jgi:hypothetical protein
MVSSFARYPELRRRNLIRHFFWKEAHYHLVRTLVALALPRPLRWSALYFGYRYAVLLHMRATVDKDGCGGGPALMPFYALHDVIETATVARGAVRHRVAVL